MKDELMSFLEKHGKIELEEQDLLDVTNGNEIGSVEKGYSNDENQADGYFKDEYPLYARIYDLEKEFPTIVEMQGMFLLEDENEIDVSRYFVYDNYEECFNDLKALESSKLPSIESMVQEFKDLINNGGVDVEVKKEYNNGGNFFSFNIYYGEDLIIDGVFSLNEAVAEEVKETINALNQEIHGYTVEGINKIKGNPSWEKSYEFELRKDNFTTTVDIEIIGDQGNPKRPLEYLEEECNWDELEEEYIQEMEEKEGIISHLKSKKVNIPSQTSIKENAQRATDKANVNKSTAQRNIKRSNEPER